MKVDAVVLAGAPNQGSLREASEAPLEALIEIDGKPMITYVFKALRESGRIGRVAVVGPEALAPLVEAEKAEGGLAVELAGDGGGLVTNLQRGLDYLNSSGPVLIVTCDIPLLTAEALNAFLDRCGEGQADVFYPIVGRADSEARYPGLVRTYVKLADGEYTGGNLALLSPQVVRRHQDVLEQAVALRKNPVGLARLFGLGLLVKLLLGRLRIRDVEQRFEKAFGLRGKAVLCPYPEIGFDVDKPADLAVARRFLEQA